MKKFVGVCTMVLVIGCAGKDDTGAPRQGVIHVVSAISQKTRELEDELRRENKLIEWKVSREPGEHIWMFYTNNDPDDLQQKINWWLSENKNVEVTRVFQAGNLGHNTTMTVTVWYRVPKPKE